MLCQGSRCWGSIRCLQSSLLSWSLVLEDQNWESNLRWRRLCCIINYNFIWQREKQQCCLWVLMVIMDLVTKDLYHTSGVFLIFPLVYHLIQTLPLINYVVINPCWCSYLFHLNKFVLASWLRTKAFSNFCQCRKWPQVNYTFNPVGISHFN